MASDGEFTSSLHRKFIEFQKDLDNPRRAIFARVGDATRRLIERLVTTMASNDQLHELARDMESVASKLESYPQGRMYEGFAEAANSGSPGGFFDHSPVSGVANPLAPPIDFEIPNIGEPGTNRVVGRVNFGAAYEGPPGCVHGGFIAAAFDELLGRAQSLSGRPGMTASLTVNYRKTTPLKQDLVFEGFLSKVEGRKVYTKGSCMHKGIVVADAEALFITIDFDRLVELAQSQNRA